MVSMVECSEFSESNVSEYSVYSECPAQGTVILTHIEENLTLRNYAEPFAILHKCHILYLKFESWSRLLVS